MDELDHLLLVEHHQMLEAAHYQNLLLPALDLLPEQE
jgi:hypothetical protein